LFLNLHRRRAMGTTVLNFFDLPPAPTQGSRRRFAVGQNRTMSFSSLSSGYPITARDGHDFPWLTDEPVPGVAAVIDDVVEGFENSWCCRM
jgi:hypothetical protein